MALDRLFTLSCTTCGTRCVRKQELMVQDPRLFLMVRVYLPENAGGHVDAPALQSFPLPSSFAFVSHQTRPLRLTADASLSCAIIIHASA